MPIAIAFNRKFAMGFRSKELKAAKCQPRTQASLSAK